MCHLKKSMEKGEYNFTFRLGIGLLHNITTV